MRNTVVLAFLLTCICPGHARSDDLVGQASVIDGDTIEIHGERIRFFGIDAPESSQTCEIQGKSYSCGRRAALALADRIGRQSVVCHGRDRDRYGRTVAVCTVGGKDLGAWLVSVGWALAYRKYSLDYVDEEAAAQASKAGLWAGEFMSPWEYRHGEHQAGEAGSGTPSQCLIKGNISQTGERIYHVPGQQYYDRTRIEPSKGERWFCSEEDALAAGWRRAR